MATEMSPLNTDEERLNWLLRNPRRAAFFFRELVPEEKDLVRRLIRVRLTLDDMILAEKEGKINVDQTPS